MQYQEDGAPSEAPADELAKAREEMAKQIEELMDSVGGISFGGVGTVGLLVFIYGATALLRTMEGSFNAIFDAPHGRPWYLRVPMYYTVITLAPVVLIVGQLLQRRFLGALEAEAWTNWLAGPIGAQKLRHRYHRTPDNVNINDPKEKRL